MNKEYLVFFNGFTWTCEVEDENEKIIGHAVGDTSIEALENAMKIS